MHSETVLLLICYMYIMNGAHIVAPEVTNRNCISLQIHGLGQNFSVNESLLYGMNCLCPLSLAHVLVLKAIF